MALNTLRSMFAPNLEGNRNCFKLPTYNCHANYKISPSAVTILPKYKGLRGENPYAYLTAFEIAYSSIIQRTLVWTI